MAEMHSKHRDGGAAVSSPLKELHQIQQDVYRAASYLSAAAHILQADDQDGDGSHGQDPELRREARDLALKAKAAVGKAITTDMDRPGISSIYGSLCELWAGVTMVCSSLKNSDALSGEDLVTCPEADVLQHLAEVAGRDNCEGINGTLDHLQAEESRKEGPLHEELPSPDTRLQ